MEDAKPYNSATSFTYTPQNLRPRHSADVPEDVQVVMSHLNDPNYDIHRTGSLASLAESFELDLKRRSVDKTVSVEFKVDFDNESQTGSSSGDRAGSRASAIEFDDESPYPEVRASVSSIDDPNMPVSTFRAWFLGIFFAILIPALNQTFSMRYPSLLLSTIVVQLVSLPMGKGLERILPSTRFRTFGYIWTLNPGPFNVKEHVVITVMGGVVMLGAYSTDIIATQKFFYSQPIPFVYQILLAVGTQLFGFSLAGVLRRFLVWPSAMIWPGALVNSALFNTLHRNYNRRETKHMSRQTFFFIVCASSFSWYWLPGYLWTGLSFFTWVCWIAPNNVVVNQLFGGVTGLGMSTVTFDWTMISFIGSPLVTPWWSEANTAAGFVLIFWFITPLLYYTNTWYTKYLPISARSAFDNTGNLYDPHAIFTNGAFDVEKYRAYSPLFLSPTQALAYALGFASFAAIIVHSFLWYRHDIVKRFSRGLQDERDVHSRLMQAYPEAPNWWYLSTAVVSMTFILIAIHLSPTQMPIWGVFLAASFGTLLSLPIGIIQAITNQQVLLNVIGELFGGYVLPNRPVANMIFKAVAYIVPSQAMLFTGDLKLGHYMKIPPRIMFIAQSLATVICCFVVTGVQQFLFANIPDICTPQQKSGFICPSTHAFATASLVWGGIGPQRLFSPGALYSPLLWFFFIGAVSPLPFYFLAFRYPLSFWRYVNMPVFFASLSAIPPASGINYSSWALTGFIFQYYMRRYHFRWWMRYNYILSAGLDAGVAIASVVIFFSLQLPRGGITLSWWGNNVWMNTADANGTPFITLQPNQTFGPPPGSWK